jgi:hypothetical protein
VKHPAASSGQILASVILMVGWMLAFVLEVDPPVSHLIGWMFVAQLLVPLLNALLHELAHCLAAKLVGFTVRGLQLGTGEAVFSRSIGSFRISIGRKLWRGAGLAFFVPPTGRAPRARLIFTIGAPYLLHVALFFLVLPDGRTPREFLAWYFAGYQLFSILLGLWPSVVERPSDGMQILRLWKRDPAALADWSSSAAIQKIAERLQAGDGEGALEIAEGAAEAGASSRALRGLLQMLRSNHAPERMDPKLDGDRAFVHAEGPTEPDEVCIALGDPQGEDGALFVRCLDLLREDRLAEILECVGRARDEAPEGPARTFWEVIHLATRSFDGDDTVSPNEAALVAQKLPWFDSALLTHAYALIGEGNPEEALEALERSTLYPRLTSPAAMREGYRAIALCRLGRSGEAKAAWDAVREDAFPALTRQVEAVLV